MKVILAFMAGIAAGYFALFSYKFSASRIIVFLPFFLLGYLIQKDWIIKIPPPVAVVIFILTYSMLRFFIDVPVGLLYGSYSYVALGLGSFGGVDRALLYVSSIILIICFFSLVSKTKTWFTTLGQRTLNVYLLHGLVIMYTKKISIPQHIITDIDIIIYTFSIFILVIVLSSYPVSVIMNKVTNPFNIFRNTNRKLF